MVHYWQLGDKDANEIIKQAAQSVKYKWAFLKLRNARFHLIENRTVKMPEENYNPGEFVSNAQASDK